jgi:predicted RNase H-like HicB family nuclease
VAYWVVIEKDEDFSHLAHCPAIPSCHSQGNAIEEAIESIKDAIRGCLSALDEDFFEKIMQVRKENDDAMLIAVGGIIKNNRKKSRFERLYTKVFGLDSEYSWDITDDAYLEYLLNLVGDAGLRTKIGENARKAIEAKFDWTRTVNKYIKIYKALL